jgi:hypothetical protein
MSVSKTFPVMARPLTMEVMRKDKQQPVRQERAPEPDFATACAWATGTLLQRHCDRFRNLLILQRGWNSGEGRFVMIRPGKIHAMQHFGISAAPRFLSTKADREPNRKPD